MRANVMKAGGQLGFSSGVRGGGEVVKKDL